MTQLSISIKNGYGIRELDQTLPFDANSAHPQQNTNIIYAQNGVMKSSFTRTLRDKSNGDDIKDHIFGLPGSCTINDENGHEFPSDQIISVPSFVPTPLY